MKAIETATVTPCASFSLGGACSKRLDMYRNEELGGRLGRTRGGGGRGKRGGPRRPGKKRKARQGGRRGLGGRHRVCDYEKTKSYAYLVRVCVP